MCNCFHSLQLVNNTFIPNIYLLLKAIDMQAHVLHDNLLHKNTYEYLSIVPDTM